MSKQGKRKITVELPKSKDLTNRPSVFERLGIKKASSAKKTTEHCRQWAQHGSCAYGKSCKFAATHTLISPSKQRAANRDSEQKRNLKDDAKNRLHSTVVVRRSPDGEIDNWDQNDLEYADTDVLEKRRLELQRELELQLKMDGKDMRKDKKKPVSSSSSSRSSSSSSASSSSSGSSSSSSSGRDARRKGKKGKLKRNSSSSSDGDVPSKKKIVKNDTSKRDKVDSKKSNTKKDDKQVKKTDVAKKKVPPKTTAGKKSLSPGKKSGGTPPITSKIMPKGSSSSRHGKSPPRKDRNKSVSKDREKDRDRKERDKEKDRRARSRSPKKARSRSPRRQASTSKDNRKKDSSERSRPVSPKKPLRRDVSADRHRKKSRSRDRARDNKDKSLEKRKDKNDDKDRNDRKDRGRDRNKDNKRDDSKRRGRDRPRAGANQGLAKPSKPMERLLPRPEERLAALAAITNKTLDTDKNSTTSKDRQDTHSERGGRKQDRERDRSSKRDRMDSIDREPGDYELDRPYELERDREYDRADERDRYDGPREDVRDRSPDYPIQGRDRHYDPGYDMPRPVRDREYPEGDERYRDPMSEHREMGYDDRRPPLRDRSWEGRSGSMDRERGFPHPHKEWDNEDYRGGGGGGAGEWNRERHWPIHDPQVPEWGDKEGMEGWHRRGRPGPHRGRMHDNYNRGMRMDDRRRPPRVEPEPAKEAPVAAAPPSRLEPRPEERPNRPEQRPDRPEQRPEQRPEERPEPEDDKPVPDDLSEISDDPDDILNQDDMLDQTIDEESQPAAVEESSSKNECSEKESTQDTSDAGEEKAHEEPKEDDDGLDFEEISDGELEEERTRAGLGDALGVDWASLVADVHRREQTAPIGGARDRWRPERVLSRLGLSVHMAGKHTVEQVMMQNAESQKIQTMDTAGTASEAVKVNGVHKDTDEELKQEVVNVDALHPVAAIQVATEKRKKQRAILFGSGCEITRGLSARRDLALRRYLCHLPEAERTGQTRVAPQPSLFNAARALLMQAPVKG